MIRILLIFLVIYLIFRFIRNITIFTVRSRQTQENQYQEPAPAPKHNKLIEKDEGEYVDYEELKK